MIECAGRQVMGGSLIVLILVLLEWR